MFSMSLVKSAAALAAVSAATLAGCVTTGPGGDRSGHRTARAATHSVGERGRFSWPLEADNVMFPLRPGSEFVYRGKVAQAGKSYPHTDLFTVTDLTKVIDGVRTVVAWDRDLQSGKLQEQELAFFAQDDAGNVWNFGEYPEEFSARGESAGAPDTWIKGLPGSYGGLHMLTRPTVGTQYREGLVPRIEFNDMSKVIATGQEICVPAGCYHGVLQVDEWSSNDRTGGIQTKYYAPGVGLVRVGALSGDSREFLALTAIRHLAGAEMSAVRAAVLAIDRRAYRVSDVYWVTTPAVRR